MIRQLWNQHRVATSIFVIACLAALFFAVRLAVFTIYWADPAHRDLPLEAWMTPGYVAMSWDVPREVVGEALGLEPASGARKSLETLAAERGVPVSALTDTLRTAIADFRASKP